MKRWTLAVDFAVVAGAVALDQAAKIWVVREMGLGEAIPVLPFLALLHARNEGIAFSMLAGTGGVGLAVISVAVLGFVGWLWWNTPARRRLSHFAFAIIVGGAIGNLIDRVSLGYVVDYLYVHTPVWSFAVFNLADSFITVGAALILLDEFLLDRRGEETDAPAGGSAGRLKED